MATQTTNKDITAKEAVAVKDAEYYKNLYITEAKANRALKKDTDNLNR